MKKIITKLVIIALVVGLFACVPSSEVRAEKKKTPSLSQTNITLFLSTATKEYDRNKETESCGVTYLNIVNGSGKPSWKSDNKKIATVSKSGTVRAVSVGTTTIKCKTGGKTLKCKVTVKKMPSSKAMNKQVSISSKIVNEKYVKVTINNKLSYPVEVDADLKEYDGNGKLLQTLKMDGEKEKFEIMSLKVVQSRSVGAKSKVSFYVEAADNCSYCEIKNKSVKVDKLSLGTVSINSLSLHPMEYTLDNPNGRGAAFAYKEDKKIEFPLDYGFQILVYKEGELVYVLNFRNSSGEGEVNYCDSYAESANKYIGTYIYDQEEKAAYLNENYTYKFIVTRAQLKITCND